MIEELGVTAQQIGEEIIDISSSIDESMERWSDVSSRPYNLSDTECVGFINKESNAADRLSIVIDVKAPTANNEAILRIWAIESIVSDDHTERFNNVQMNFSVDYDKARAVAKKGSEVTRDDIRSVLHDQYTQLTNVTVSNQSGFDKVSQRTFGERYELILSELNGHEDIIGKTNEALKAVSLILQDSVGTTG